jgi:molybdopterin molybdotransferase
MIPVADARARILAGVAGRTPEETLPVARGLGRVLARDVRAPFDVPPADNSAVDGYAVRGADLVP